MKGGLLIMIILACGAFSVNTAWAQVISVDTSKDEYETGDTVVISGKVSTRVGDTPVTMQVLHSNTVVEIGQIEVAQDGSYTHTIKVGSLWKHDGEYVVRVKYGSDSVAETRINITADRRSDAQSGTFSDISAGSSGTFDVEYVIRGGTIRNIVVDSQYLALVTTVEPQGGGSLTLTMPRSIIDARSDGCEGSTDSFIVLVDGSEVQHREAGETANTRTVEIGFDEDSSNILIIGTCVVPEFGAVAVMILAATVILAVALSRAGPVRTRTFP